MKKTRQTKLADLRKNVIRKVKELHPIELEPGNLQAEPIVNDLRKLELSRVRFRMPLRYQKHFEYGIGNVKKLQIKNYLSAYIVVEL